jgi:hypothetical protein
MTKFFYGLPVGGRVTMRLTRTDNATFLDADVAQYGIPPTTGTPTITFNITLRRAPRDLVAPCQVWLRATGHNGALGMNGSPISEPAGDTHVYDPTQCELTHIYFFPDEGYTPYNALNLPTAWADRNVRYGKQVAHVFTAAGDKEVTCFCFDSQGRWGFASYKFGSGGQSGPIITPDSLFGSLSTISLRVDSSGDFTGATSGSVQVTGVTNLRAAMAAMWNAGRRNIRVELRAGDVFIDPERMFEDLTSNANAGGVLNPRQNLHGLYVTRFGTGANPKIRLVARDITCITSPFGSNYRQTVCTGVDFEGTWDPTTENGRAIGQAMAFNSSAPVLLHRSRITGLGSGFDWGLGNNAPPADDGVNGVAQCLSDVSVRDWANYAVNGSTNSWAPIALLDTELAQNPDALTGIDQWLLGGQTQTELGNRHGARHGNNFELYFSRLYYRGRGGWSNNSDRRATVNPPTTEQGMRLWANFGTPGTDYTRRCMGAMDRVAFEGGGLAIGPTTTTFLPTLNMVIDKALFVGTAMNQGGPVVYTPGVTVRNAYVYVHNIGPQGQNTDANRSALGASARDVNQNLRDVVGRGPVRFINCTAINLSPSSSMGSPYDAIQVDSAFDAGSGVFNCVERVVNRSIDIPSPTLLGSSPLAGFVCTHKALRWNFPPIGTAGGATPPTVGQARLLETGTSGTCAPGEWIKIAWPNFTGLCNGAGMADVRAAVLANSTQNHQTSIAYPNNPNEVRQMGPIKGGAVYDTSDPTGLRIQNTGTITWPSTAQVWVLLDLKDSLMTGKAGTSTDGIVLPAPRPLAGSSALNTGTVAPRSLDDFFGTRKPGSVTNTGSTVPGSASQGAFEPV